MQQLRLMRTSYRAFFVFALFTGSGFAEDSSKSAPARTGQGEGIYKVVRNWPKYPEGKKLGNLHGDMAADSKGKVYIATGGTIQVISPMGSMRVNCVPRTATRPSGACTA